MIKWRQAPVVQKLDNAIHRINHYTLEKENLLLIIITLGWGGGEGDLDDYMETGPSCSKGG